MIFHHDLFLFFLSWTKITRLLILISYTTDFRFCFAFFSHTQKKKKTSKRKSHEINLHSLQLRVWVEIVRAHYHDKKKIYIYIYSPFMRTGSQYRFFVFFDSSSSIFYFIYLFRDPPFLQAIHLCNDIEALSVSSSRRPSNVCPMCVCVCVCHANESSVQLRTRTPARSPCCVCQEHPRAPPLSKTVASQTKVKKIK